MMNLLNSVDIWLLDKVKLLALSNDWWKILSIVEQQRANRFHFEKDKKNFILYHACKRLILSRYLKKNPKEIIIYLKEKGKPFIENEPLLFNLSHTKDMAILAVTRNVELGVDIEKINPSANYLDIAKRFFHPDEYHQLMKIEDIQRQQHYFFVLWTAKEAILKATGEGLSAGLNSFTIRHDSSNPHELKHTYPGNISLKCLKVPNDYVATLAIVGEKKPIIYRELSI